MYIANNDQWDCCFIYHIHRFVFVWSITLWYESCWWLFCIKLYCQKVRDLMQKWMYWVFPLLSDITSYTWLWSLPMKIIKTQTQNSKWSPGYSFTVLSQYFMIVVYQNITVLYAGSGPFVYTNNTCSIYLHEIHQSIP